MSCNQPPTQAPALARSNLRLARRRWGRQLTSALAARLRALSEDHGLHLEAGELLLLEGQWYVTHSGLLALARRRGCAGIVTRPVSRFCDPAQGRWTFQSTVYTASGCRGFVGYGDADPGNVSDLVRGAELRIAETRAVNRALRKAYGIGLCSVEELGAFSAPPPRTPAAQKSEQPPAPKDLVVLNGNGRPRLRDRLAQLIRQHRLDPELVKLYAADFCGTEKLRDAGRELVEDFINTLADWARTDRDGLVCKLNSYPAPAVGEKESAA